MIVEDEPMIAEELEMILQNEGWHVVGKAYEFHKALDMLATRNPDMILLDIRLGTSGSGTDLAEIINEKYKIPIIFITSFTDQHTMEIVKKIRPAGYVVKPFKKKDIIVNIQLASIYIRNKTLKKYQSIENINKSIVSPLTIKEYNILVDLAKGMSNEELSSSHFITLNTVKTHLKNIFSKLDVQNRSSAILKILSEI